ncbi:MAG TPA: aldehyde ferredoxin oxidoreductase family protein [Anaerolineae bacterium]|nr:aldehyde ferredoxin oxidoreductase family protein [Anaerolineae bacterium]
MIGGIHGKILHVDLATGETRVENPPDEFYRLLVGGRAVAAYLLLRDLPPDVEPLAPDNLLLFVPGIMQGTSFPGAGRHGVAGKSPLTGGLASSEVGGWWGHELKRAGYDALVIRGRAESPVYLWIHDGEVEIRPADHLWGMETAPTQALIHKELADDRVRVAQIGPAGENLVRYAAVMHDVNRAAGRNGLGALMGSKNLKAVAVRGTLQVPVADRTKITEVARWLGENYKERMSWAVAGIGMGTQGGIRGHGMQGSLPTRNFQDPLFEEYELLSGERNYEMFLEGRDTCMGCPVHCKQVFKNDSDDPWQRLDPVYGGAEYEAMGAFGPSCDVTDNLAVLKANERANAYGLDAISTGMSIAFVMECFEKGWITAEDTDGIEYHWGDAGVMLRSVEMIAHRQGFGDLMAEGVDRMSIHFGPETEPANVTVKGQELPMHEPRAKVAMGLGYAVAPVGADHMMNSHDREFARPGGGLDRVNAALNPPAEPVSWQVFNEEKMRIFTTEVNWRHFQDCCLNCHFYDYEYHHLAQALSGATGVEYTIHDILDVGARAQALSRLFNVREGFTVEDDVLPRRVMTAFEEGPLAGVGISDEDFAWARRRFYEMMDWDPETGVPTAGCLQKLGLETLMDAIG